MGLRISQWIIDLHCGRSGWKHPRLRRFNNLFFTANANSDLRRNPVIQRAGPKSLENSSSNSVNQSAARFWAIGKGLFSPARVTCRETNWRKDQNRPCSTWQSAVQ